MKFISLIVLFLTLSTITPRHLLRHGNREPLKNILFKFMMGFLMALNGEKKFFDECTKDVSGWELVGKNEEKLGLTIKDLNEKHMQKFKGMLKYLGKDNGLDAMCNFKDQLIEWMTIRLKKYRRMYIQGPVNEPFKWNVEGMWPQIEGRVKKIAKAVVNGAKKVNKTVIKSGKFLKGKIEDLFVFVAMKIKETLQPLLNSWEKCKKLLMHWFNTSDLMKKAYLFVKCFYLSKKVKEVKTLYVAVQAMVTLVPKLNTPMGWADFIVNITCGWQSFKVAIDIFEKAIKEKDLPKKYFLYGRLLGKFWEAFAA